MPDMERITDQLRVDMAKIGYCAKGRNADFWDGYRHGKSAARKQVAITVLVMAALAAAIALKIGGI